MFSGSFTDNFGYKKSLYTAFTLNIFGYVLMANANSFWAMMLAGIVVGTGTAIFKPPVQGTIASSVNEENSSLGFGFFYWIVNIGGFLAPMMASYLRGNATDGYTWSFVFYGAAIVTAINFIPTIFFYTEPENKNASKSTKKALEDTFTALKDKDFMMFLLIFSGFWLMFMQLWDLLPNFINQWVDSRELAAYDMLIGRLIDEKALDKAPVNYYFLWKDIIAKGVYLQTDVARNIILDKAVYDGVIEYDNSGYYSISHSFIGQIKQKKTYSIKKAMEIIKCPDTDMTVTFFENIGYKWRSGKLSRGKDINICFFGD